MGAKSKLVCLAAGTALALTGCTAEGDPARQSAIAAPPALDSAASAPAAGAAALTGRSFEGSAARGRDLIRGTALRITFAERTVSVTAGCNSIGGRASWADGRLRVGRSLTRTTIACGPEREAQDDWVQQLVESAPVLMLRGSTLDLGDAAIGIVLTEVEG